MLIVDLTILTAFAQAKLAFQRKADRAALARGALLCATALALGAAAGCAAAPDALLPQRAQADARTHIVRAILGRHMVLFGEVHDNAVLHDRRLQIVSDAIAAGARPAFVFEQFDREMQAAINAARAEKSLDADHLIALGSPEKSSWNWAFYRPLIQLALDYDLPIIAANLSRRDAMKVAQSDAATSGAFSAAEVKSLRLDQPVAPTILAAQAQEIIAGHCNLLPAEAVPAMANAQLARDAVMAGVLTPFTDRGVILFAGNGHTRRDIGAAAWLPNIVSSVTVGMLESNTPSDEKLMSDARYDVIEYGPAQPRVDPCIALKARFKAAPAPP